MSTVPPLRTVSALVTSGKHVKFALPHARPGRLSSTQNSLDVPLWTAIFRSFSSAGGQSFAFEHSVRASDAFFRTPWSAS